MQPNRGPTFKIAILLAIFGLVFALTAATIVATTATENTQMITAQATHYGGNSFITNGVNLAAPPAIILSSTNCATNLQRADEALMIARSDWSSTDAAMADKNTANTWMTMTRNVADVYGMVKNDIGVTSARIRYPGTAFQTITTNVNAANTACANQSAAGMDLRNANNEVTANTTVYTSSLSQQTARVNNMIAVSTAPAASSMTQAIKGDCAIDSQLSTSQASSTTATTITLGQCAISTACANTVSDNGANTMTISNATKFDHTAIENGGPATFVTRCSTSTFNCAMVNNIDQTRRWIPLSAGGLAMVVPQYNFAINGESGAAVDKSLLLSSVVNVVSPTITGRSDVMIRA